MLSWGSLSHAIALPFRRTVPLAHVGVNLIIHDSMARDGKDKSIVLDLVSIRCQVLIEGLPGRQNGGVPLDLKARHGSEPLEHCRCGSRRSLPF